MSESDVYHYLNEKYYQRSHWFWIIGHLMAHKQKILFIIFLTLIAIAFQTVIPLLFGYTIDNYIATGNQHGVYQIASLIIALGIFRGILSYIAAIINEQVSLNIEMQVRLEFFENISRKSMDFFNKSRVGDLMSQATQDTQNLTFAISPGIRSVVNASFGLLATLIAMSTLSIPLTLVFLIVVPFYFFYLYSYAVRLQPISMERQERLGKINAALQENITGIRVVRTFSGQERERSKFYKDISEYEQILIRRGAISAFFIPTLILALTTSVIFLCGVYIIEITQEAPYILELGLISLTITVLTIGDLIAFITLMGFLLFPTEILRFLLDVTMLGFAGSKRIFNTLSTLSILDSGENKLMNFHKGKIIFDNVTFSYDEQSNHKVLDNFSLTINSSETVVLLGPTGSGKSTVGKLLQRLYNIQEGRITIDGQDISQVELTSLRSIVGVIEQDVFLFSTSIAHNIAYGIENIDQDKIEAAAKAAQAHEFIMSFKDGYNTIIGEKGVTLSGGQRQRIAMARTFITDPKILIMDDSTSAIDSETEYMIQQAITKLVENRTTIIVTHRLSTLREADKIVFMRRGQVIREGLHTDLLNSFEPYRQIFSSYIDLPPLEDRSGL
jgi:ATP-binding cassette, subfamily B, bacterial